MQLNNKQFSQNDLSILIHKDGFSFCTLEQHYFLSIENTPLSSESLKSFLDYHQLKQQQVQLIFMDKTAICVPQPLFDKDQIKHYFKGALEFTDKRTIKHCSIDSLAIELVYDCDTDYINLFTEIFPQLKTNHLTASLLPSLSAYSFGAAKKNLFIHIRKNHFDLFLFQGGQLLLQNTFPQKNAEDFLYYVFYVTEQFYLKPDQFNLFFLGRYSNYNEYYQGVEEFHQSIAYLDPQFPNIDAQHPAPFLQSFFPACE